MNLKTKNSIMKIATIEKDRTTEKATPLEVVEDGTMSTTRAQFFFSTPLLSSR